MTPNAVVNGAIHQTKKGEGYVQKILPRLVLD
jgi:hypothetical protein